MNKVRRFCYRLTLSLLIGLVSVTANPIASYADKPGIESAALAPKLYIQHLPAAFISSFLDTKSIASVPEEDIHEAINRAIEQGEAVAFDITKDIAYYFDETMSLEQSAQRLQEAISGIGDFGRQNLINRLNDKKLLNRLRWSFMLIKKAVKISSHRQTLQQRRYLVMFGDYPAFNSADILEHAGVQQKTKQYGISTIFLPLPLLNFIDDATTDKITLAFRQLLEHADFHLRGNPNASIIENHAYSSQEEYNLIRVFKEGFYVHQKLLFSESAKDITLSEAFSRIRALCHLGEVSYIQLESEDSSVRIGTPGTFFIITPSTADKTLGLVRGVLKSLNAAEKCDFSIKRIDIITQDSQMNVPAVFLKYKVDEEAEVIDILAPLDRENARQVLDAYHNLVLSGHQEILELAYEKILVVNSLIKEGLGAISEDVVFIMERALSCAQETKSLETISYGILAAMRSIIRMYIARVDQLELKFTDPSRQQQLAASLNSLEDAYATALNELAPRRMIELFPRFNHERKRKMYRVIGLLGENGTLYTYSAKTYVFKAIGGSQEIAIDSKDMQDWVLRNGKLLVADADVSEHNLSAEEVMQLPSRTQTELEPFVSKLFSGPAPHNLSTTKFIEQAI